MDTLGAHSKDVCLCVCFGQQLQYSTKNRIWLPSFQAVLSLKVGKYTSRLLWNIALYTML